MGASVWRDGCGRRALQAGRALLTLAALAGCHGDDSDDGPPVVTDTHATGEVTDTFPQFYGHVPKNLLIFSIDTFRRDHLGKYNPDGDITPFLSQLMDEGYTLDNHMTCANWTFMGTGCTMNGRNNEENGFIPELGGIKAVMPDGPQIASVLKPLGFYSILVTGNSWFSSEWNMAQGFDEEELTGGAAANIYGEGQAKLSGAILRGAVQDRWYLHVHVMEPHAPYVPPDEYLTEEAALDPIQWDLANKDEHYAAGAAYPGLSTADQELLKAHMQARYNGEIRYLDDQFKTIWFDLASRGLLDDTLVVFWDDHGEQFWEHGDQSHAHKIYAEENNGFLFFWAQNIVPGTWEGPTSQIDLLPTLNKLYGGGELSDQITGIPLGEAPEDRARFVLTSARNNTMQAVRKDDWKMVYTWATAKVELFNVAEDPGEFVDLYTGPSDPVVQELWGLLEPRVEMADTCVLDENPHWPVELPGPDDATGGTPADSGSTN